MSKSTQELQAEIAALNHEAQVKHEAYKADAARIENAIEALQSELDEAEDAEDGQEDPASA